MNDPVSYFAYRGQLLGFDYELAKLLAARLRVRLEIVVPPERALLVPWLLEGRGDLVAATMHPSSDPNVANSLPYLFTDQVQVGASTSDAAPDGTLDPVEQVQRALDGTGAAVLADRVLLQAMSSTAATLAAVQTEQPIVYLLRKKTPKLQKAADAFVTATYHGLEYNILKKRYFEANRAIDAQCFHESRFDPKAHSWAGAVGLFQLMPMTAQELGIRHREDPSESIRGGAEYDARMLSRVDPKLALKEQIRFEIGRAHV